MQLSKLFLTLAFVLTINIAFSQTRPAVYMYEVVPMDTVELIDNIPPDTIQAIKEPRHNEPIPCGDYCTCREKVPGIFQGTLIYVIRFLF